MDKKVSPSVCETIGGYSEFKEIMIYGISQYNQANMSEHIINNIEQLDIQYKTGLRMN